MKLTSAATLLLASLAGVAADYFHVQVDVTCGGVNWDNLPAADQTFSAEMLQKSYNELHAGLDKGDKYLAQIHWEHSARKGKYLKQGGGGGSYGGGWHCEWCDPDYDDAAAASAYLRAAMINKVDSSFLPGWTEKFEELLQSHPNFANVRSCSITKKIVTAEDAIVTGQSAAIEITTVCGGVSWETLTAEEEEFATTKLMSTYNEIQKDSFGGDKVIDNLHWERPIVMVSGRKYLRQGGGGGSYGGGWHCEWCDPDYDDAKADFDAFTSVSHTTSIPAWELAFTNALSTSDYHAFQGVTSCAITVSKSEMVERKNKTDKKKVIEFADKVHQQM